MNASTDSKIQDLRPMAVYWRLLGYAKPYRPIFFLGILGLCMSVAVEVGLAAITKPLTDETFIHRDAESIRWMPFAILGLFLMRGIASFVAGYCIAYVAKHVVKDLRGDLFKHLLKLPVRFYDRVSSGQLISRLTYHVEQVADACTNALTTILQDGLTIIALLCYLFWLNWELTLFTLVVAPFIAGVVRYVSRRFRSISARIQKSVSNVTESAEEAFGGQRVIKIHNGQPFEAAHFEQVNQENRRLSMKMVATQLASTSLIQFIAACALASIVFFATQPGVLETITPGTFVSFMIAMARLLNPMRNLTSVNERLQRGIAAGTEIFQMMQEEVEPTGGTRELQRARGQIEFRNVHFRYRSELGEALSGVSVRIEPGQTVAFVGRSGSGKSTLLALLPRFYDPVSGQILLDGYETHEYPLSRLRDQVSLVDQNVRLFNASIADNIAYGLDPKPDDARIIEAAKFAYAWEFIEKLPLGLSTPVGQNGVMLSGGQRQRLAIARALLKNAPILILDEATSALDTESERYIQSALEKLVVGRTTLVIAHRLSTIQRADLIVVMHEGRVVESGQHDELLAKNGYYASLHNMQFQEGSPEAVA